MSYTKYKVLIKCMTYNHSGFITDALNGFCIQKTNFPFVCCIVDDASSDGEQDVIKKYIEEHFDLSEDSVSFTREADYAHIIYAQHKENKNCYAAVFLLKENHYRTGKSPKKNEYIEEWRKGCEYVALCEGDDYWTDCQKLQKQVNFLDANHDYSMCFANAIEHWQCGEKEDRIFSNVEDREYSGEEVFEIWTIPTASVMYRMSTKICDTYTKAITNKKIIYGDICIFLACVQHGRIRGMRDVMSVYRKHSGGMTAEYSPEHIKKQAYHNHEIYKIFGNRYKKISIERFAQDACEAFWTKKSQGIIDWKLLFDIARFSPLTLWNELKKRF